MENLKTYKEYNSLNEEVIYRPELIPDWIGYVVFGILLGPPAIIGSLAVISLIKDYIMQNFRKIKFRKIIKILDKYKNDKVIGPIFNKYREILINGGFYYGTYYDKELGVDKRTEISNILKNRFERIMTPDEFETFLEFEHEIFLYLNKKIKD